MLILVIVQTGLFASFESVVINPASVRIGNISGFKNGDIAIPFTAVSGSSVTANYMIPFGLSELAMQEAAVSFRIKDMPFIFSGTNFGNADYRENSFSVSALVYRFEGISIMPGLSYYSLNDVLGVKSGFSADITAGYRFTDGLGAVVSVQNIYAYETDEIDIPLTMHFNFEYKAPSGFNVYTGVEKDDKNDAIFKTGLEYSPLDFFAVSAGYNFDPQLITAGFSIEYGNFSFGYGMSYHFDLEDSHSAGIVYEF
jgi:hypothetical protein